MNSLKQGIGPFLGGVVFALGLGVAGMTEPQNIIGFLDLFGEWNPSLAFVMVGAIGVHALMYRVIKRRRAPLFDAQFYLPNRRDVDTKLLLGSALFGIGWGITGLCPGPGFVGLTSGSAFAIYFFLASVVGVILAKLVLKIL